MNNFMHSTILNSTVANQTVKNVKDGVNTGCENTKEDDRFGMLMGFFFGVMLGVGYLLMSESDGFIDFVYLFFYFICLMPIISVSWDDEQGDKVVKTALVLQAILSISMLVPFILDTKDTIGLVFMTIWCLCDTIYPLVKLYKMQKNSVK